MRNKIFTILFFLSTSLLYGQFELESFKIGNDSYIKITIESITKLLDQPMEKWETLMIKSEYTKMDDSEGIMIYSKGVIGERIQAIAKNRTGLISIDWYDYTTMRGTTSDLVDFLQDYHVSTDKNLKYYYYKDFVIGIETAQATDYIYERVLIKRK